MTALSNKRKKDLEAIEGFKQKQKIQKRKGTIKDYMTRHEDAQKDSKTKTMIDFNNKQTTSIKLIAIQKNLTVNLTTRFTKGKMLMSSRTSLSSFVYYKTDVFCFPQENKAVKDIYEKHEIQKYFIYQNLTDTDSTSLFFVFICDLNSQLNQKNSIKIIFEVLIQSSILKRLDLSDDFWTQFGVCNPRLKKQVGPYETESIDNANIVTIAVNPKEYFVKYLDKNINKKHKA